MPLVFHIWALPKWAGNSHTPIRGVKRVGHQSFAVSLSSGDCGLVVSPEFRHGYADVRGVKPVPAKEKVSAAPAVPTHAGSGIG